MFEKGNIQVFCFMNVGKFLSDNNNNNNNYYYYYYYYYY